VFSQLADELAQFVQQYPRLCLTILCLELWRLSPRQAVIERRITRLVDFHFHIRKEWKRFRSHPAPLAVDKPQLTEAFRSTTI
jgi:hypothetical protein